MMLKPDSDTIMKLAGNSKTENGTNHGEGIKTYSMIGYAKPILDIRKGKKDYD